MEIKLTLDLSRVSALVHRLIATRRGRIGTGLALAMTPFLVYGVTKPNTFSDGTTISASQVNANFDTVYGAVTSLENRVWKQVSQEHFGGGAGGWSNNSVTVCGVYGALLGGYNTFGGGAVSKTFSSLPAHTQVRVAFDYIYIDSWDGESGYANVDGNRQWTLARSNCCSGETNICGSGSYPEVIVPVEFELAHTASSLSLAIGSTLDQSADDESFGVDNVRVYVR